MSKNEWRLGGTAGNGGLTLNLEPAYDGLSYIRVPNYIKIYLDLLRSAIENQWKIPRWPKNKMANTEIL